MPALTLGASLKVSTAPQVLHLIFICWSLMVNGVEFRLVLWIAKGLPLHNGHVVRETAPHYGMLAIA